MSASLHAGYEDNPSRNAHAHRHRRRHCAPDALSRRRRRHRPEAAIGREIAAALKEAGVPASAIYLDDANTRIPLPTETGNLIVDLPGRGAQHNQPPLLFMTHMDTVPLCAGAKPKLQGRKIVNTREDRARRRQPHRLRACSSRSRPSLRRQKLDHPPLTLLFTVREESGLWGARYVDPADLGGP